MFDEVVFRINLGCRLAPGGHLAVGRFGYGQAQSIVAVSHSLDKLVVHDTPQCSSVTNKLAANDGQDSRIVASNETTATLANARMQLFDDGRGEDGLTTSQAASFSGTSPSVYYIAVRDIIKTVSVRSLKVLSRSREINGGYNFKNRDTNDAGRKSDDTSKTARLGFMAGGERELAGGEAGGQMQILNTTSSNTTKDLLLIGCSNSILVYDALNQSNLYTINTPTPTNAIANHPANFNELHHNYDGAGVSETLNQRPTVCGGSQKVYTLKLGSRLDGGSQIDCELACERSTGDTITCLIQGQLSGGIELVITGSVEHKIRAYQLDSFDHNIQACRLTIEESARVECLCAINTITTTDTQTALENLGNVEATERSRYLPSIYEKTLPPDSVVGGGGINDEQMNYFAYGLENGYIGVYRLIQTATNQEPNKVTSRLLTSERLWRHKCKYAPVTMLMYDINGDGLDELLVGFGNSRLEARSPFTGQLMAATRCFKYSSSERLVGLSVIDYYLDDRLTLLACSASGSMIGFRPRTSRPRIALQGYNSNNNNQQSVRTTSLASATTRNLFLDLELEEDSTSNSQQLANSQTTGTNYFSKTIGVDTEQQKQAHQRDNNTSGELSSKSELLSNLHIESKSDDTKATRCEARQNLELLQRINSLQSEQLELERRACHIYHMNMHQASKFYSTDLSVAYKWDFDLSTEYLRLTIIINTELEDVKLIELEDESKNLLPSGHILVNFPARSKSNAISCGNSQIVVIPLRSSKNTETILNLRIFCQVNSTARGPPSKDLNNEVKVSRVYDRHIHVPKFSMLVLAAQAPQELGEKQGETENYRGPGGQKGALAIGNHWPNGSSSSNRIKMIYQLGSGVGLILDWLNESFLCFQFERLIRADELGSGGKSLPTAGPFSNLNRFLGRATPMSTAIIKPPDLRGRNKKKTKTKNSEVGEEGKEEEENDDGEDVDEEAWKEFELSLIDIRHTLERMAKASQQENNSSNPSTGDLDHPGLAVESAPVGGGCKFTKFSSTLRIAYSNGTLTFECENSDLVVDLVQSLMIDRLHLSEQTAVVGGSSKLDKLLPVHLASRGCKLLVADMQPILDELDMVTRDLRHSDESEKRIQSELYESADYTRNLMEQLAIANELNEFTTAKELLSELFVMLTGAQNAARAHHLNNRRPELSKRANELREKVSFLSQTGQV